MMMASTPSPASSSAQYLLEIFTQDSQAEDEILLLDDVSAVARPSSSSSSTNGGGGQYPSGLYGQWYSSSEIIDALVEECFDSHGRFGSSTSSSVYNDHVLVDDELVGQPKVKSRSVVRSIPHTFYDPTTTLTLDHPTEQQNLTTPPIEAVHEIPFKIHTTVSGLRIRWIDEHCRTMTSHTWDVTHTVGDDGSSQGKGVVGGDWIQYVKPGNLFLLSVVRETSPSTNVDDNGRNGRQNPSSSSLPTEVVLEEDLFTDASEVGRFIAAGAGTGGNKPSNADSAGELLLGAYRPLRTLPTRSDFLTIKISKEQQQHEEEIRQQHEHDKDTDIATAAPHHLERHDLFVCETVLSNPYDVLVLAASHLDPAVAPPPTPTEISKYGRYDTLTTIKLLTTIVKNLIEHPYDEPKYRRLRLSNLKIKKHIVSSWAAMRVLKLIGFEEEDENKYVGQEIETDQKTGEATTDNYLVVPDSLEIDPLMADEIQKTRRQAMDIMTVLSERIQPGFVPDLAPPTPWEFARPSLGISGSHSNNSQNGWWQQNNGRMGFITDEERWRRAERNLANRRSGRSRRPNPGEAPSSRGNWGR